MSYLLILQEIQSEAVERKLLLQNGKVRDAFEGLLPGTLAEGNSKQLDVAFISHVIELMLEGINWTSIIELHKSEIANESAEEGSDSSENEVASIGPMHPLLSTALDLLRNVRELHFPHLLYLDEARLSSIVRQSRATLRVLDISGMTQLSPSCLKPIARYAVHLEELILNQLEWTTYDGQHRFEDRKSVV